MKPINIHTQKKLIELADKYQKEWFDFFPELGMYFGRTDIAQNRFMDHSLSALSAWQKKEDDFLAALKALDEEALKNLPEYNTYQLLKETLENNKRARVCKDELWNVNPLWGWHNIIAAIVEKQPVGTPEYRRLALQRWRTFDTVVNDEMHNLKIGITEGYTAPKPAVQRVLKQLKIIINTPVENSPYLEFAKRDGDPAFKKQMLQVIETVINPSLKRYAYFLEEEYLPIAREEVGLAALPYGAECYAAKIQKETTLNLPAETIHEYGLSHMHLLKKEVATIGQREFGIQEMKEVFYQAKTSPQYLFHSEQDILNYNQAALARAKAKVDAWFKQIPKADGTIKPYPLHRAQTGAAGEYHPPSDDGQRPGIFYINTFEPQKRSRIDQEATLFHELIPGHHFQFALSFEDKSHHGLDKYLWNAGFGEGWALYTERLTDEMGLYSDDISRLGMLSNEALRTARLVVDPGLHVMGWSRQQAVDYLKQHTALDENIIESEVDRYIMTPGQATSYMLGKREIENLRQLAKVSLGERFDIREYHYQVLKNGAVTLPMLRAQIEAWLAAPIT
ncbi:MAG: hypothetical protein BGO43_05170 [Gammaproteobacteria bacterium 39-13]|nr:DUF885 domain-containing protein [Gammaproteobacteria bacterium]OJV96284.1 MAG: hypothetical protein BGO43_05170 [Gammaproteobacteria bacterium 39-13]